jgi:long-chain acyl-CoA synthetase
MVHRIRALPAEVQERFNRKSMRVLNIGAAAVPVELKAWALEYFGSQCLVFEGYGMSETQMISYMLPEDWPVAPNSSGKPMPFVDVKILAPDGTELGPNEKGEICARTPFTIDRYLNRPPLGPEDLTPDGFFRTGDVGYLDDLGYLYVTDRIKDMIIVGGMNVYPAEIEAVLATHPDIVEAAVIGIPDPDLGEQVVAFCELRSGAPQRPEELIAHCRASLAAFKAPREVRFIAELPRNATGKVTKNVLRAPFWQGRDRKV